MKTDRNIIQLGATGPVATFTSTYQAQQASGVNQSNISKCLSGKLKTAGGFRWVYADQEGTSTSTEKESFWLWSFTKVENELAEIIVADYNAYRKRRRSFEQLHQLLPKYLYFPHQLIQAKNFTKVINCHKYAEITADSPSNFQKVVNAWKQLGVVEITRDSIETTDDEGKKTYTTREYRLTPAFQNGFKVQRYFDESYGTMVADLIAYNEGVGENNSPRKRRLRKKVAELHQDLTSTSLNQSPAPAVVQDMATKEPAVSQNCKITKEMAFQNIEWMLQDSLDELRTMPESDFAQTLWDRLMSHSKVEEHMADITMWLQNYLNEVLLPKRQQIHKPAPVPQPKRKCISNEEWEMRTLHRQAKEENGKTSAGTEYVTMSFDGLDL